MKSSRSKPAANRRGAKAAPVASESSAKSESEGDGQHAPRMKLPEVLAELEEAAKQLSVRVTYEAIGGELGAGGLCKVKGHWRVIIDKRATPSERVSVLAPALARFGWAELTLAPPVRELLERLVPKPEAPASQASDGTEPAVPEAAEAAEAPEVADASPVADPSAAAETPDADGDAGTGAPPVADSEPAEANSP